MSARGAAALFRLLATLAVLGQVLVGALVVPDDARAADFAGITAASTLCGAPPVAPVQRGRHAPLRREPACTLSLSLASHAAPLATHVTAPMSVATESAAPLIRPLAQAMLAQRLHAAPPARGPPFGF